MTEKTAAKKERATILVELPAGSGMMGATRETYAPEELVAKSSRAIKSAMATIEGMVEEVNATVDNLAGNPDELEFTFGLTFTVEGNALVAKAGAEAAIEVKVVWRREGRSS